MAKKITVLNVNAKTKETRIEERQKSRLEGKLGGFGQAIGYIQENLEQNPDLKDAYDERNLVCMNIGFLTGSNLMTARRVYFSGLSPLKTSLKGTNGIFYSAASGNLGPALRSAGLDSVNITGKSDKPVYLVIENGNARFEDARELKGKTSEEKIRLLKQAHPEYAFAAIGQAGELKDEKAVRYANIAVSTHNDYSRFSGRGGLGSVLGNKNILAIAVKGDNGIVKFENVVDINKEIATGKATNKYRTEGTMFGNLEPMESLGVNAHENFSHGTSSETSRLKKENLILNGYEIKDKGCLGCAIKCWKEINKQGNSLGKIDFEPGMLLGSNLGIYDIEQIMHLIRMTDSYGVDSISAGVSIGYEMERVDRFGDFNFATSLLEQIVQGKHGLKEGVLRYSNNAWNAMHVKGIELAAYPGNFNLGYAFAIAGGHMSIDTYNRAWIIGATNSAEEWIDNICKRGFNIMLYDMNGACKFSKINFEHVSNLFGQRYGETISEQDLRNTAISVYKQARKIDYALGFSHDDDTLPERCFLSYKPEVVEGYPSTRHFLTKEFFNQVKQGVYSRLEI